MKSSVSWLALFLVAGALVGAGCASAPEPSGGGSSASAANAAAPAGTASPSPQNSAAGKTSPVEKSAAAAKAANPVADKPASGKTAPPPSRIGDVRVSLFTLTKGKFQHKEYMGTYLMLVNPSWVKHKRPYTEPFFQFAKPGLKIVEDDVMETLLRHLTDSGFWNMPETSNVDLAALRRPTAEGIRYVTVNRDGVSRTVERARLGSTSGLLDKFINIEYGINQVWHSSTTYVTETQRQNWLDAFQSHYELKKAQERAEEKAMEAPAGTPGTPAGGTGGSGASGTGSGGSGSGGGSKGSGS